MVLSIPQAAILEVGGNSVSSKRAAQLSEYSMSVSAILALVISILSLGLATLSYYRNTAPAQLRRNQLASMRIIAARSIALWDQISTVISAQTGEFTVDPYLFPSIQENAVRLEEALDDAIGLGLLPTILEDKEHAMTMYSAFVQGLMWIARMPDPEAKPLEVWTKHISYMV